MARPADPVWDYATRENKKSFICNFCLSSFTSNARRFKFHLAQVTKQNIRICDKVPPEVKAKCLHWLGQTGSETEEHHGKMELKKSILRFFNSHGLPLELVDDPGFAYMFCSINHFGFNGLPSEKELKDAEYLLESESDYDDWD